MKLKLLTIQSLKLSLLFFGLFVSSTIFAQVPNIAPAATPTHSGGGSGVYAATSYNDNIINPGSFGWVTTPGGWIQFEWPTAQTINEITIHNDQLGNRMLIGATIESWNGTGWVAEHTFNVGQVMTYTVSFYNKTFTSTRLRLNSLVVAGTPQATNPAVREIQIFYVPQNLPVANFISPDTAYRGTDIKLTSTSLWYPSVLRWDIGNDGTVEYNNVNQVTYSFTGGSVPRTEGIELAVSNFAGADSIVKSVVVVDPSRVPNSDFVADRNIISEFESANFTDLSDQGANSWNWTVSPGINNVDWIISNANAQNPSILFITKGAYTICLQAGNILGAGNNNCKSNYIIVENPLNNTLCSQTSSTRTFGNVYDSGGPTNNYFPNLSCGFLIEPCGGTSVTINFSAFTLGTGSTLRLYNGQDATAPLLGSYTGTAGPIGSITASSGKMYVFLQAAATVGAGFAASWTSVIAPPTPTVARFNIPDTAYIEIPFNAENTSTGVGANYDWYFDYPNNPFPAGTMSSTGQFLVDYFTAANSITSGNYYNICLKARSCSNDSMVCDSILVIDPFRAPDIDFTADKRIAFVGQDISFAQQVNFGAAFYLWRFSPNSVSFQNSTTATSPNPVVRFNAAGKYTVELIAGNSFGTDSNEKYQYIDIVQYCIPALGTPNSDVGISRVELADINNTSTTGVTGYNDFLNKSTELFFGVEYDITVERATNFNNMGRKVWIDFNTDGDFNDPGELITSHSADKSMSHTGSFFVPPYNGSNTGGTRMRVSAAYNNSSFGPCSSIQIGEVEDYTVVLTRDEVAPTLTLVGSPIHYVEVNTNYPDSAAIALDNLEGDISWGIVVTSNLDMTQTGIYTIRYNVKDASGNSAPEVTRTVIVVVDKTPPVITLNGLSPMNIPVGVPFVDPGATATDNYSGNLTQSIVVSGALDINTIGQYTLTYSVADAFGLTGSINRIVNVEDKISPVINPVPGNTTFVQVLTPFIDPVTVSDNYDINLSATTTGGPVNTNNPGTYVLTYNAVDNSGNAAIPYVLTVIVRDILAPVLNVNSTDTIIVEVNTSFTLPTASYSDDYSSVTFVTVGSPNINVLGTYPVVYRATDGAGNKTEKTIYVKVVDTTKPIIKVLGSNPANIDRWKPYVEPTPAVAIMDNYYTPAQLYPLLEVNNQVDATMSGSYYIWYKVTDLSGNASDSVARLVVVMESLFGVNDINFNGKLNVYPNPSSGLVNVNFSLNQSSDVELEIFNSLGELIQIHNFSSVSEKSMEIDLSSNAQGVYYVRIKSGDSVANRRIVVTR